MVETVIALPERTLPRTRASIYLWILSNKKTEAQKGCVRLIDASSFKDSNRPEFREKIMESIIAEYKNDRNTTMSLIVKNEQLGFYEIGLLEDGRKKEMIKIPLDVDINEYIQKEHQPFAKGIISVDYNSVEKGYVVSFDKFFKSEYAKVEPLNIVSQELISFLDSVNSIRSDIERTRCLRENRTTSELWGWREQSLRSLIDVVNGGNRPSTLSKDGLPVLSVAYLRKQSSEELTYAVTSKTKCASAKDVLIIMRGENSGEIFRGIDGIMGPSIASMKCKNEKLVNPRYLYYLLKGYEKSLKTKAKKSPINSLDIQTILDFKCLIPPIEEQFKILSFIDHFVERIDIVIKSLNNADNVFTKYRQILIENVIQGKVIINS